jgi:LacI family transcriptional regulator
MKLKELAGLLGLSTTTVSRALNGYPEVNARTRARVIAAAREHRYAPSQVAKRLATGRTLTIGHVIPLAAHQMINPLFAEFLAGSGEVYSAAGYDMILSVVPAADEAEAYRSMASQRKVDGIIVAAPRLEDPRIALLARIGLPFVVHGRDANPDGPYSWLDMNNRRAFQRATELLIHLGHRRIALINGIETMSFAARRRTGYEAALAAGGLDLDERLIRGEEMTEPLGYSAVHSMLRLAAPPTAFVTSSLMVALGVHRALRELGLRVGRDVSVVTHDDDLSFLPNGSSDGDGVPLFTATRSSVRVAGRRAAEMLIELIADPQSGPHQELWEAELTLGRSTGPNPEGPAHV